MLKSLIKGETVVCDSFAFFDQNNSGVSILALLCNSNLFCKLSNVFSDDPEIRECVYTSFLSHILKEYPYFERYNFDRS